MMITTFSTFALVLLPHLVFTSMTFVGRQMVRRVVQFSPYFGLCYCLNSTVPFLIYTLFSSEFKKSFFSRSLNAIRPAVVTRPNAGRAQVIFPMISDVR